MVGRGEGGREVRSCSERLSGLAMLLVHWNTIYLENLTRDKSNIEAL